MQHLEFVTLCLGYLARLFPEMDNRLATDEQIERWVRRFGHLGHDVWKRAVDAYADDNHFPPTVNKLMEYVPETERSKTSKPYDPHDLSRYDKPRSYEKPVPAMPAEDDRLSPEEVRVLMHGVQQAFNARGME